MSTRWRIGIDEAGYGPTLGPLVVAVVRATDGALERLREVCTLPLGDSKKLWPGAGLAAFERTLWAAAACSVGRLPGSLSMALGTTPEGSAGHPWYGSMRSRRPDVTTQEAVVREIEVWESALGPHEERPLRVAIEVLFETPFNAACAVHESKAAVELEMIGRGIRRVGTRGEGIVSCDRLGGRRHYESVLGTWFPGAWARALAEDSRGARYAVDRGRGGPLEAEFLVGGEERQIAIALASVLAKATREIFMRRFNLWWSRRVPGVRPTAGYPLDARRFLGELRLSGLEASETTRLERLR